MDRPESVLDEALVPAALLQEPPGLDGLSDAPGCAAVFAGVLPLPQPAVGASLVLAGEAVLLQPEAGETRGWGGEDEDGADAGEDELLHPDALALDAVEEVLPPLEKED